MKNARSLLPAPLAALLLHMAGGSSAAQGAIVPPDAAARGSVAQAVKYLGLRMDEFHNAFDVKTDVSAAGDHFHFWAQFARDGISSAEAVAINGSEAQIVHSGATSVRCTFTPRAALDFGGWLFLNGTLRGEQRKPEANFGTEPEAGFDLSGAVALSLWAKGERGGETVTFSVAGIGHDAPSVPYRDSSPAIERKVRLTKRWAKYRVPLTHADLSYVLSGFGWGCGTAENPRGTTFYLDDIRLELGPTARARRLDEPRFLRSYFTRAVQPDLSDADLLDDFDFVLRNASFIYDDSLAILALLAEASGPSVRRAILLGDALVYAAAHDREFTGGALRDAVAAGDLALPPGWTPLGKAGTVPIPGFFLEDEQTYKEVLQEEHSVGNQAWAMIALLALHERTGIADFLTTARQLGDHILTFQNNAGTYRGFFYGQRRGLDGILHGVTFASTEHNLDVVAAFTVLHEISGEAKWQAGVQHALDFVDAMWDEARGCYYAGTLNPEQRNDNSANDPLWHQLPVDVQAWGVLALPQCAARHARLLACAQTVHAVTEGTYHGFDFNDDRDGLWPEGTAQVATAYATLGEAAPAQEFRRELQRLQRAPGLGFEGGLPAALHDGLTTGFGFAYYNRPHIGATAWNVFAQLGVNPYYLHPSPPARSAKPAFAALRAQIGGTEAGGRAVHLSVKVHCFAGVLRATARIAPPTGAPREVTLTPLSGGHVGGTWQGDTVIPFAAGGVAEVHTVTYFVEDTENHTAQSKAVRLRITP